MAIGLSALAIGIGSYLMPEVHAYTADAFVMVVKTDNPGTSNATSFTIPITGTGYSYNVDCNDDGINEVTARTTSYTCVYGTAGTYTVAITGTFPRIYFNNTGDRRKLLEVKQWGTGAWTSMASAFRGCSNLHITATDAPNLTNTTNMSRMFEFATSMNEEVNHWNTSSVTDMSYLFAGGWDGTSNLTSAFNKPLTDWNTSAVTNMSGMFYSASTFNQSLANFNTSAVTNMSRMFFGATAFNQSLTSFNTSNVTDMSRMFFGARTFNQPLTSFNTSAVTNMSMMFNGASAFNQPLTSFNTSNVTDMSWMFSSTTAFNQPLANWNTSAVTNMSSMFSYTTAFNQPLANWNTSAVTNMSQMFIQATAYNQPLDAWDVSSVTNMANMFYGATAFNQPLSNWNTSAVTNMSSMFFQATAFNQPLANWNTSAVTDMSGMFSSATAFNQPLANWNTSAVTNMSAMFSNATAFNQPLTNWNTSAVTNMNGMFYGTTAFNQPLGAWDVSKVTSMSSMFNYSKYPRTIYEQTLAGWATQTLQPNVPLGATGVCYLDTTARNTLTSAPNNWVITDGGVCKPVINSPINGVIINDAYQLEAITGVTRASSAIRVSIDGTDYASTSQPDGSFSYQVPTELANGSHTLTVSLLDGSNNVISTSSPVNFTIQYNPTVISTPTNQTVVNTDKPSITGTTLPNHALTIVIDGNQYASTSKSDGSFDFQVPVPLSSGWRTAEVRLLNMNSDTLSTTSVNFYVHAGGDVAFSGAAVAPTLTWQAVPSIPTGTIWQQTAADTTSFPARGSFGAASLNGKLWVIGGSFGNWGNNFRDVWSSSDGIAWTQELASAPWSARNAHTVTSFNGKLWVMGGQTGNTSTRRSDIWSSPDGVNWTQEVANAPWGPRAAHETVVHDGKLWIMGGADATDTEYTDVWNSSDGINWTRVTDTVSWPSRRGFAATSFNDKLWVMGGLINDWDVFENDVWSSTDGVTWTEEATDAAWPVRASHQVEVFDDKMWVLGGSAASWDSEYSDVWFSENGKDWHRTTEAADWQARRGHSSAVFNDKLWVLGGRVGDSWTLSNDVWSAALPITTYTICWDTIENGCAQTAQTTNSSFTIPSNLAKGTWHFKVTASIPGANGTGTYTSTPYQFTDPVPTVTPLTGKPVIHPVTGAPSTAPQSLSPTLADASLSIASYDCSNLQTPSIHLVEPDGLRAPETNVTLLGGVGFSVGCTSNGKSADVSLALGTSYTNLNQLRAYKQTGAVLTDITNQVTFTNQDINGTTKTVASYSLVDGGELDEDGVANGTLVDPIFIGVIGDAGGSLANTGFNVYALLAVSATLLASAAAIWRKGVKAPKRMSFR